MMVSSIEDVSFKTQKNGKAAHIEHYIKLSVQALSSTGNMLQILYVICYLPPIDKVIFGTNITSRNLPHHAFNGYQSVTSKYMGQSFQP